MTNTSTLASIPHPPTVSSVPSQGFENSPLESTLQELKRGRHLEQVAASIESFLLSQVSKVGQALDHCQAAADQNQVVQRILADFESQKEAWESERDAEARRLFEAGEKLMQGWKQLEQERQNWLANRNNFDGSEPITHRFVDTGAN